LSIKWMDRVWSDSPYEGARLLLHLAMADHANDEGWFYAGQNSLARKARCSVEYVRQSVLQMVEDGALVVERKGVGKGRATEYRLLPVQPNSVGGHEGSNSDRVQAPQPHPSLPNSDRQLPNSDRQLPNSTPNQPSLQPSNQQDLVPATVVAPNSGQVITAWIDGLRTRPPDRVVGQTAREVRLLLDQGFDARIVLDALRSISAKGLHPSTLASEVNTIINPPTTMRGGASTAEQRLNGLSNLLVGSDRESA
jgi:hypothetical protein